MHIQQQENTLLQSPSFVSQSFHEHTHTLSYKLGSCW